MKNIIISTFILLFTFSCSDAKKARMKGSGSEFTVEMLNCDGTVIKSWISTGKVRSGRDSEGYYFMDKATGLLVEVTGSIIITQIPDSNSP